MTRPRRHCLGFALMMAIFMIVTLAAIAISLMTISTGQVHATTQDEQGARAYHAARSGLDWAAYRLLRNGVCASGNLPFNTGTGSLSEGLNGFHAEVTCAEVSPVAGEAEGAATIHVYLIISTACNAGACTPPKVAIPGSPAYVERQLQVTLARSL